MIAREAEGKDFGVIVAGRGVGPVPAARYLEASSSTSTATSRSRRPTWPGAWSRLSRPSTSSAPARASESPVCSSATKLAAPCRTPSTSSWAASSASAPTAPWWRTPRRRLDLLLGPAQPQLCPLRHPDRPRYPGDRRPLHPARIRLPPPGPVPGELSARLTHRTGRTAGKSGKVMKKFGVGDYSFVARDDPPTQSCRYPAAIDLDKESRPRTKCRRSQATDGKGEN